MKKVPRVVSINDMSGFGRCSLTVAIPILSVMGVQCCPIPTAVLSRHTGFDNYFFKDLTDILPSYINDWKECGVVPDAVYSGFLGSYDQIKITEQYLKSLPLGTCRVIDTVMGDNGKIYSTYTEKMCREIKTLVSLADVITPNVTEACYLSDEEYKGESISIEKAEEISRKLCAMGTKAVVITGIDDGKTLTNFVYENNKSTKISIPKSKKVFSGTGDLFASVLTGAIVKGNSLEYAVGVASQFISDCIEFTIKEDTPVSEGVLFEPLLYKLGGKTYEK